MTHRRGFTLLELIIVITVFGIIAAISIPALNSTTRRSELRAAAREMYGHFQRAKSEAIKRNQPVAIVFDTSGVDYYQVFVDSSTDPPNATLDAGEDLLAEVSMPNGLELQNITFTASATGFDVQGRPLGSNFGGVDIINVNTGDSFRLTTSISGYVHLE